MVVNTVLQILSFILLAVTSEVSATGVQRFLAAPKRSHLRRRAFDFDPHQGRHTLLYEDESSIESAARVHLEPKYPTIVLDDISHHIRDVVCSTTDMIVHFYDPETAKTAVSSWNVKSDFVLVTSHTTCAEVGSHEPYVVRYMTFDGGLSTITFMAQKQTFKETTHRVSIDIGRHVTADIVPKLKRRQVSSTGTIVPTTTINNVQTASLPATVSFAFQPPTGTAVGSKDTEDISFLIKDKAVLPPDQRIISLFPGAGPLASVNLGCKECSMSGSITLEAAGFSVNSTQLERLIDFFDDGYFQFTTHKLFAHMEVDVGLLPGFVLKEFVANLTRIPLNPIEIPRVLKLGPAIELTIPMSITLNSPINFTTGFELTVPDNSKIILNVSEINNSSQTGFDKTSFRPLPFTATADDLNFNLSVALKPKVVISAGVGNTNLALDVEGGAGAFMNFPRLVANIGMVQNVNQTCNGPAASGTTNKAVRVIPTAVFDMGLHWEMGVKLGPIQEVRKGEQVLATKSFPLPNQCLVFDNKTRSLVPAGANGGSSSGPNGSPGRQLALQAWKGIVSLLIGVVVGIL